MKNDHVLIVLGAIKLIIILYLWRFKMYVYIQSEKSGYYDGKYFPGLWTVGFHSPNGNWHPESDHDSPEEAAKRVAWLNGGKIKTI